MKTSVTHRGREKERLPVWALVVIDVLATCFALGLFMLFHLVLPRIQDQKTAEAEAFYTTSISTAPSPEPAAETSELSEQPQTPEDDWKFAHLTTDDVVIRNSPEDKGQENSIGSLNTGDTVTVLDSATDSTGIQWYLVELPNKNRGYVKAQWVSEDGTVPENSQQEEQTQQEDTQQEDAQQQEAQQETVEDSGTEQVGETPDAIDDFTPDELKEKASDSQESPDLTGGDSYNPFTDPEAHYSMHFYTENDGTGEWYIYNYDTDSRIRIGDLEELNTARTAAEKNASSAKIWRTIACILLILLIVVLALLYMIINRNSPAPRRRSGVSSRRGGVQILGSVFPIIWPP